MVKIRELVDFVTRKVHEMDASITYPQLFVLISYIMYFMKLLAFVGFSRFG